MLLDVALKLGIAGILGYGVSRITLPTPKPRGDLDLIIGHDTTIWKRPIKIDLNVFPSLSISGISNCGKSKMVEYILKHTNLPITLVNSYEDDYKGIKCNRVTLDETEDYLDRLLTKRTSKRILVVFDECLTIVNNKTLAKKLHTLLTKNRHNRVYIICVFQELNKTLVPFKSLFTARITMRMIQTSDVMASLGTTIENYRPLQNREFLLLSDDIYRGKTYDI